MIKLFFYTILLGAGGYALVTRLPDAYKEKMLAAIGWGEIQGQSFVVFNPAAKREDLLAKLEENLAKVENIQIAGAKKSGSSKSKEPNPDDSKKNILIEGQPLPPGQLAPLIQEQKEIIEQLKDLNPKTGLVPKALEKILGLESKSTQTDLQKIISQISPEAKAEICK